MAQTFTNASQTLNCPGGNNADLQIQILAGDIEQSPAGSYSGSLTITIAAA